MFLQDLFTLFVFLLNHLVLALFRLSGRFWCGRIFHNYILLGVFDRCRDYLRSLLGFLLFLRCRSRWRYLLCSRGGRRRKALEQWGRHGAGWRQSVDLKVLLAAQKFWAERDKKIAEVAAPNADHG